MDEVRQLFDELGDGEWYRFERDALSRVSLEVHRRFLRRHVPEDAYVLEIGAGPGRFTIELAQMGCRVVVTDISPVQLALNERRVAEAGREASVVGRRWPMPASTRWWPSVDRCRTPSNGPRPASARCSVSLDRAATFWPV